MTFTTTDMDEYNVQYTYSNPVPGTTWTPPSSGELIIETVEDEDGQPVPYDWAVWELIERACYKDLRVGQLV